MLAKTSDLGGGGTGRIKVIKNVEDKVSAAMKLQTLLIANVNVTQIG